MIAGFARLRSAMVKAFPVGLILQASSMPRSTDPRKAKELTRTVQRLGGTASFRNILRETARASVIKDNKTLRRYLDLLLLAEVLEVRTRNVGSVRPQELYRLTANKPKVSVGPAALRMHGLNWDVPERDMRVVSIDFDGLSRSTATGSILIGSLEDCLVYELHVDARKNTETLSFVIAMVSTKRLDLPYLIRRADEMQVGRAVRCLFHSILAVVSSKETETNASLFLAVRTTFLKIARQYAQSGFQRVLDEKGVGKLGLERIKRLTGPDIIIPAAKQLGVSG